MNEKIRQALLFYDKNIVSAEALNDDNDAFMLTDGASCRYFMKIYGKCNDYDIVPGERVYHTYEQVNNEAKILRLLSDGVLKTAAPIKNINGEYVTTLQPDTCGESGGEQSNERDGKSGDESGSGHGSESGGESGSGHSGEAVGGHSGESGNEPEYALMTAFVDGMSKKLADAPTVETAYAAGVAAARLHLESKRNLLQVAIKRPHKRQEYINKILYQLRHGITAGTLTGDQYKMVCECGDAVIDCMNRLDEDPDDNIGLVHTDIINGNIIFNNLREKNTEVNNNYICTENDDAAREHINPKIINATHENRRPEIVSAILIDFSRSVYSYYLFDLAEMCFHGNFGGAGPELQEAIVRGYHSVKPLERYHLFAIQALFAMFIMTVMAECVFDKGNAWMQNTLKWFAGEVHPGLLSGKGYINAATGGRLNSII